MASRTTTPSASFFPAQGNTGGRYVHPKASQDLRQIYIPERQDLDANQGNPKKESTAKRIGAGVLFLSVLYSSTTVASEMIVDKQTNPIVAAHNLKNKILQTDDCPAIPDAKALALEKARLLKKQRSTSSQKQSAVKSSMKKHNQIVNNKQKPSTAKIPTIVTPKFSKSEQNTEAAIKKAKSAAAIAALLNKFTLAKLDLTTKLDMHGTPLRLEPFKKKAIALAQTEDLWDVKLTKASGVKTQTISDLTKQTYKDPTANGGYAGLYNYSAEGSSVILDANYIDKPANQIHEIIGHGEQFEICDGVVVKDLGFSDQNPVGAPYLETDARNIKASVANVFASNYSATNVKEDYAKTTDTLATNRASVAANITAGTPLGIKYEIVASRMDNISPGSVDAMLAAQPYLEKMNNTPTPNAYDLPS